MIRASTWAATGALAIALGLSGMAKADVYLSLGDSVAFGETVISQDAATYGPYADPSDGTNRGFVPIFASHLASQNGGVAPSVVNLAVDGETISSFASGVGRVPPGPGYTDAQLAEQNTNYGTGVTPPTQAALLASTIGKEAAAMNPITAVTISLGSNDLFALALTDPNALTDLPATLKSFGDAYGTLVSNLKAALPDAKIYLIGTFNPFTGDPSSPFAPLAGYAIPMLNDKIAGVASANGAYYVDTYDTLLTSDAKDYTLISHEDDVHPYFDKGYTVIADQIAAVPEPSTFALLATGAVGALAAGRMRRRRIATPARVPAG